MTIHWLLILQIDCSLNYRSHQAIGHGVTPQGLTLWKMPHGGGNPWVHISPSSGLEYFLFRTPVIPCILGILWQVIPNSKRICHFGLGWSDLTHGPRSKVSLNYVGEVRKSFLLCESDNNFNKHKYCTILSTWLKLSTMEEIKREKGVPTPHANFRWSTFYDEEKTT